MLCNTATYILASLSCRLVFLAIIQVILQRKKDDTLFLMLMHVFKLLLNPKLKAVLLDPSVSFISFSLPFSLLLSFYLYPSSSSSCLPHPLYPAMLPLTPLPDLWQQTEESCPPPWSEVRDPHWEMEMPHHCLSAHHVSLHHFVFMSAGIRSAGMINWRVCCPQSWQSEIQEGIFRESHIP